MLRRAVEDRILWISHSWGRQESEPAQRHMTHTNQATQKMYNNCRLIDSLVFITIILDLFSAATDVFSLSPRLDSNKVAIFSLG